MYIEQEIEAELTMFHLHAFFKLLQKSFPISYRGFQWLAVLRKRKGLKEEGEGGKV